MSFPVGGLRALKMKTSSATNHVTLQREGNAPRTCLNVFRANVDIFVLLCFGGVEMESMTVWSRTALWLYSYKQEQAEEQ